MYEVKQRGSKVQSGKPLPTRTKLDVDEPSSVGWWEKSHGKMPVDSDAGQNISSAKEEADCYGPNPFGKNKGKAGDL